MPSTQILTFGRSLTQMIYFEADKKIYSLSKLYTRSTLQILTV
jgi:hypothetical protein